MSCINGSSLRHVKPVIPGSSWWSNCEGLLHHCSVVVKYGIYFGRSLLGPVGPFGLLVMFWILMISLRFNNDWLNFQLHSRKKSFGDKWCSNSEHSWPTHYCTSTTHYKSGCSCRGIQGFISDSFSLDLSYIKKYNCNWFNIVWNLNNGTKHVST